MSALLYTPEHELLATSASGDHRQPQGDGIVLSKSARRVAVFVGGMHVWIHGCGNADPRTVGSQTTSSIIGTWRAVEYVNPNATGDDGRYPFGRPPRGYLVYDKTGHVFLQVLRGLATSSDVRGRWRQADSATLLGLLNGTAAYFGSYRVNSGSAVVIHKIEGEIPPNLGLTEVATPFRVTADTLRLGRDSLPHWTFIRVH